MDVGSHNRAIGDGVVGDDSVDLSGFYFFDIFLS
jgi:hypothetical protein